MELKKTEKKRKLSGCQQSGKPRINQSKKVQDEWRGPE